MASPKVPARRPRRPGRPSENDADLRERLIDAALARFVAEGIAAASLKSIARQAGVTPALVHYYFGSKDQLLSSVIEERLMVAVAEMQGALAGSVTDPSARQLVRSFVAGVHATVARHPWLPILWVREILTEGGALRELLLGRVAPMIPQLLAARFAQAQEAGQLNRQLDPRLLVVSLMGLTLFPLAAESIWRSIFRADDIDHLQLQKHTLALLDHGLEIANAP